MTTEKSSSSELFFLTPQMVQRAPRSLALHGGNHFPDGWTFGVGSFRECQPARASCFTRASRLYWGYRSLHLLRGFQNIRDAFKASQEFALKNKENLFSSFYPYFFKSSSFLKLSLFTNLSKLCQRVGSEFMKSEKIRLNILSGGAPLKCLREPRGWERRTSCSDGSFALFATSLRQEPQDWILARCCRFEPEQFSNNVEHDCRDREFLGHGLHDDDVDPFARAVAGHFPECVTSLVAAKDHWVTTAKLLGKAIDECLHWTSGKVSPQVTQKLRCSLVLHDSSSIGCDLLTIQGCAHQKTVYLLLPR